MKQQLDGRWEELVAREGQAIEFARIAAASA
jgi:hypothetical protein